MRATRGSSLFRTAVPSGGSASTSSRLPRSMASIEPARDRCVPRTAVTTPICWTRQRRQRGDVAGHVHAHLQDGYLVRGLEPQQGQWQADLVVLVGVVAQDVPALGEDLGDLLLGRRLGERAGDADDERIEVSAPDGGRRGQRLQPVRHQDDGRASGHGG